MLESPSRRIYRRLFKPAPWRRWTASTRALPDFLVIGAMRAGTTTLHDLICRHPRVVPAIGKEIHFFDLNYPKGERWYRAHFPPAEKLRRIEGITGEASPYYLFHPAAPARAADLVPAAKIVAVLRHPVERAHSHYWHTVRHKAEPLAFDEALDREPDRLAGEEDRILAEAGYTGHAHQHHSYQARSSYAGQLARWLDRYPRERVLVLEQRRFFGAPEAGAGRLFEFLELDPHPVPSPRRFNEAGYPPMAPETRERLLAHFAPHNARLFDLLGERFDWDD
ncbi:MAG TPA: sulfotransferase domain-containing protein [Anaerolineales bacterium]|nr:sulfotransferase domain-containing protein [Anaerolineales bacterium]